MDPIFPFPRKDVPPLFVAQIIRIEFVSMSFDWRCLKGLFDRVDILCPTKSQSKMTSRKLLLGGFNPSEQNLKNISATGSFPQVGVKMKKYVKPPPRLVVTVQRSFETLKYHKPVPFRLNLWSVRTKHGNSPPSISCPKTSASAITHLLWLLKW